MTIYWRKVWRYLGTFLGLGFMLGLLYYIRGIFIPFVMGFLIAYLLDPLVDFVEKKGCLRSRAIIIIYLLISGVLCLFTVFILPVIYHDLNQLILILPQYVQSVENTLRDMQIGYNNVLIPDAVRWVIDETVQQGQSILLRIAQGLLGALLTLFSQLFNLVLAPVVGFYFLKDFQRIGETLLLLIPVRFRTEAAQTGAEINDIIKKFIRGNLLVALLVAILASGGMYLIGMDFSLLIGIMVGITNFIPYFGAVIAAVPAVLLALLKSKWLALYVLGMMVVIQQLEGNIISPKIIGDSVGLHPLILIFVLLAGGQFWGFWGLLIAIPLAAILKILVKHIYLHLI